MWKIHIPWNVTLCRWVFPKLKNKSLWVSKRLETKQRDIPQDRRVQQQNCVNQIPLV
jgi:hypothetical protein